MSETAVKYLVPEYSTAVSEIQRGVFTAVQGIGGDAGFMGMNPSHRKAGIQLLTRHMRCLMSTFVAGVVSGQKATNALENVTQSSKGYALEEA